MFGNYRAYYNRYIDVGGGISVPILLARVSVVAVKGDNGSARCKVIRAC